MKTSWETGISDGAQNEIALRKQELKDSFDKVLDGNFNVFPAGNYQTNLPGLESISIIRGPENKETGDVGALNVIIFDVNHRSVTFSMTADGLLSGKLPKDWMFSREDLYEEILHISGNVCMGFFENIADQLLPPGYWDDREKKERGGGGGGGWNNEALDPRRIEFIANQPGALFGFAGINSGFRGYYGFAFPEIIVLENNKVGNALYIFDIPEEDRTKFEEQIFALSPEKRLSKKERLAYLERYWAPIAGLTKKESLQAGGTHVIHPAVNRDFAKWKAAIGEEILSRRGGGQATPPAPTTP